VEVVEGLNHTAIHIQTHNK